MDQGTNKEIQLIKAQATEQKNQITGLARVTKNLSENDSLFAEYFESVVIQQEANRLQVLQEVDSKITPLKQDVEILKEENKELKEKTKFIPMDRHLQKKLSNARSSNLYSILGSKGSDKNVLFFSYFSAFCTRALTDHFGVSAIGDLSGDEFPSATAFVKTWIPTGYHYKTAIDNWNNRIKTKSNVSGYTINLVNTFSN